MLRQFVALGLSLILTASAAAEEIAVTWEKAGSEFFAKNQLPPGATVKIRTTYIPDSPLGSQFTVNGEKFTTKAKGDQFRTKVDKDGKLRIAVPLRPAESAKNVAFGLVWASESLGQRTVWLGLSVVVTD